MQAVIEAANGPTTRFIEANLELGFQADCRNFELPAAILKQLGVNEVRLLTNNPEKVAALEVSGVKVVERLSAEIPVEPTFEISNRIG